MAFNPAHDLIIHQGSLATQRIDVAASAGANQTYTANGTWGTISFINYGMVTGLAANTTIGNGANIIVYDGVPSTANQIYSVIGNLTLQGNVAMNVRQPLDIPIHSGTVVIAAQANCPSAWFAVSFSGPGGQYGNVGGV